MHILMFLVVAGVFLVVPGMAEAFRLSPMVLNLSVAEKNPNGSLLFENPSAEKIALQIEVFQRAHIDGEEKRTLNDDLEVSPSQFVLLPGERKQVRVRWKKGDIAGEQAYRLVTTEQPVQFGAHSANGSGARLRLLKQYVTSVYVAPPRAHSQIVIETFEVTEQGRSRINLRNQGDRHALLTDAVLILKNQDGSERQRVQGLSLFENVNLLPGESRKLEIDVPNLERGQWKAELKLSGEGL